MTLLYATSVRYPSKLANPEQIVATAAALNRQTGGACILGLSELVGSLPFPYRVFGGSKRSPSLGWRYARFARREGVTHIYCREDRLLFFIMLYCGILGYKPKFFFEAHALHRGFAYSWLASRVTGLVAITHGLKKDMEAAGISAQKIAVAPDGVDIQAFGNPEAQAAARARLKLPHSKKIVMYIGQLGGWKGVETLLDASALLPEVAVAVIGGESAQIDALRRRYPTVLFLGRRPYSELADNQAAADVLVLPNTARDTTSVRYTSPLKLFSYLASGRPIVASDLPSLREVVSEQEVFFFKPDNPESLADAIGRALADTQGAHARAARALQLVQQYTWDARAKIILEHMGIRNA